MIRIIILMTLLLVVSFRIKKTLLRHPPGSVFQSIFLLADESRGGEGRKITQSSEEQSKCIKALPGLGSNSISHTFSLSGTRNKHFRPNFSVLFDEHARNIYDNAAHIH